MLRIDRRLGLLVIALMVAAVLCLSLPGKLAWQKVVQDAGHGPVFAVIGIVLALMRAPRDGTRRSLPELACALAGAVAIGAATELIQHFQPGRVVSLEDLAHDAAGATLGLALLALVERRGAARATPVAVALLAATVLAWPPLQCALGYAERRAVFPVLAQGLRASDLYFLEARRATLDRAPLPARWGRPGEGPALHVTYAVGAQPALAIAEPAPDWRGHDTLLVDITNPSPRPALFILWVLDARHDWSAHDRLNLPVLIAAETRITLRVALSEVARAPVGRRLDLSQVANVMLYMPTPATGREFYVSRIWLE